MHFIALHGFTQRAERFAERAGLAEACETYGFELHTPQASPFRNWRPHHHDQVIADYVADLGGPVILAGFSDGARTALRAALLLPPAKIAAVVFHSGMFYLDDVAEVLHLPWTFVAVEGLRDHTPVDPVAAYDWARGLFGRQGSRPAYLVQHQGGHEWTPEQNAAILSRCGIVKSEVV